MINAPEKFVALGKANVETAISLANLVLDSTERLVEVQLGAAKDAVTEGAKNAKALAAVKDVQGLIALQQELAQPAVEKAVGYSRNVYEVAAKAQSELGQLVEERIAEFNKDVIAALEQAVKAAPAGVGADAAVAAVKSAVAAASSAYDTMSKAAKQVADLTEANVTALTTKAVAGTAKKKAA